MIEAFDLVVFGVAQLVLTDEEQGVFPNDLLHSILEVHLLSILLAIQLHYLSAWLCEMILAVLAESKFFVLKVIQFKSLFSISFVTLTGLLRITLNLI